MLNGLWSLLFSSSTGGSGGGVVIFQNGKAYGGDSGYYYLGSYKIENDLITGEVNVVKHSNSTTSIFGPLNNFKLALSGKINSTNMTLSGSITGQLNLKIGIQCTKKAEI